MLDRFFRVSGLNYKQFPKCSVSRNILNLFQKHFASILQSVIITLGLLLDMLSVVFTIELAYEQASNVSANVFIVILAFFDSATLGSTGIYSELAGASVVVDGVHRAIRASSMLLDFETFFFLLGFKEVFRNTVRVEDKHGIDVCRLLLDLLLV